MHHYCTVLPLHLENMKHTVGRTVRRGWGFLMDIKNSLCINAGNRLHNSSIRGPVPPTRAACQAGPVLSTAHLSCGNWQHIPLNLREARAHTCTHMHAHAGTNACTGSHTQTHACAHANRHTQMHVCGHTHTHSHTQTHTHTYTPNSAKLMSTQ